MCSASIFVRNLTMLALAIDTHVEYLSPLTMYHELGRCNCEKKDCIL